MHLRRLPAVVAASLLVAELAHAAGFGSDHLLGGRAGSALLGSGLAWAALLVIVAAIGVALRPRLGRAPAGAVAQLADALPGRGDIWTMAATFAGGGGLLYCLLEAAEGRAPLSSPLALAVVWPIAAAVAGGLRFLLAWIARAGIALAALCGPQKLARERWLRLDVFPLPIVATSAPRGNRRGRAPPSRALAPAGV